MNFKETPIDGVTIVELSPIRDERGFFARLHSPEIFTSAGITFEPVQTSMSRNVAAGTLRGLHWQAEPEEETKLVRVTRGRIFDVAVDVRPQSQTHRCWFGVYLDDLEGCGLLIGPGIAHGYITLKPYTDVLYSITPSYRAGLARGARWNDPAFDISWPREPSVISNRDSDFPDYVFNEHE